MCITHYTVTNHLCDHRTGLLGGGKGNKKLVACDRVLNEHRHGASKPGIACPARRKRTVKDVPYPCEGCVEVGRWRMNLDDGSWMHTPSNVVTIVEKKEDMVDRLWMVEEWDAPVQRRAEAAVVVQPRPSADTDNTDDILAAAMGKTTGLGKDARAGRRRKQAARKLRLEQRQKEQSETSWYGPNACQSCHGMSIGFGWTWCQCGGTGEVKPVTT